MCEFLLEPDTALANHRSYGTVPRLVLVMTEHTYSACMLTVESVVEGVVSLWRYLCGRRNGGTGWDRQSCNTLG